MKKSLLYSRILQFSIVLSFLLPFFFVGCDSKSEEAAAADSTLVADIIVTSVDSLHLYPKDTTSVSDSIAGSVTETTIYKKEDDSDTTFSQKLSTNYPLLSIFLIPGEHVMTGASLVLDIGSESIFLNIFFAFLLLIICVLVKFIEKTAVRTQILLNILAILFLFLYAPGLSFDRLWGFWICIILLVATLALDIYRLIITRSKKLY
jgi:hypothetical protein